MEIIIAKNDQDIADIAAYIIKEQLIKKEDSRICFATGSSPIKTYKNLIKLKKQGLSFANMITFNLDEYVNLDVNNKCSYHYFMNENLFNHIDVKKENINFPNGIGDIEKNAIEYENLIKEKGGIDLAILGIGVNGHIAFNEPGSSLLDRTREVELTKSTINANKIYFESENDVPKTAISMGIQTILEAKKIILLANGKSKIDAINTLINKDWIGSECPATFLKLHKNVTIIIDEEISDGINDIEEKEIIGDDEFFW